MPQVPSTGISIAKGSTGTLITLGTTVGSFVNIQDLYDVARGWEAELPNLDIPSIVTGSGKEGLGLGNQRPVTIVIEADVQLTAIPATTARIFRLDGGTIISDEEAIGSTDPRSPVLPPGSGKFSSSLDHTLEYDRTKGQEGALLFSQEMLDMWTRLFGGRLYVNPATGKEVITNSAGDPFSDADVFSDDGVTPYDGTVGVARRDDHIKP